MARHIALIRPRLVVPLGGPAAKALLASGEGITRLRGKKLVYQGPEWSCPALPMFHPAYLLRQPMHKRLAWKDLLALQASLREGA